ncbi:hypothetical protein PV396_24450 [Streptomyces sp. ME02-8801-2C]|uniref:hypothetical protein n=1 Tax=Streptomyces sp. ME02-8801-2C TaxID=3028680 RepID=UPI0029ABA74D|nr:hypothetical protein [Streptomyces sp. ME02-8801-2C]MDX3455053.1 hypothetical protein [Streptomyces sp. ME02-8801-2C]
MTMAGNGPPPKPAGQRRRRNATVATTKLPAEGRKGRPPKWPLMDDVVLTARRDLALRKADDLELALLEPNLTGRAKVAAEKKADSAREAALILTKQLEAQQQIEGVLWRELWKTPQATMWQRLSWTREVAQYVRWKSRAEAGDLDAAKEARQLADRLGLTPLSMLRLRWEVGTDEVAETRQARAARTQQSSTRRRLRVVDPDAAAGGE